MANTVTLIGGRQVDSASEAWRHECEARHVAGLATLDARRDYLDYVAKRRGDAAGQALKQLVAQIFNAQRRGTP